VRFFCCALAFVLPACAPSPAPRPAPVPVAVPEPEREPGPRTEPKPVAVRVAAAPSTPSCRHSRDTDFDGAGEQLLRGYLEWLVLAHGAPASLKARDVELAIVRGDPKPGPGGVTAGEISCGTDDYRITLYRNALAGRPLAVAYDTLAHEFHHVVQIRRDGLHCESRKGERESYEREAVEFARKLVPRCR
jgi:hypothetical protein